MSAVIPLSETVAASPPAKAPEADMPDWQESHATRLARALRPWLHVLPTVAMILILNFFLLRMVPGDAADVIAAEQGAATADSMVELRHYMGLDISLGEQFVTYLNNLAHGNLGYSFRYHMPVSEIILSRLPATLTLMGASYVVGLVLGIAVGAVMAMWRNRWPDRVLNALCTLLYSAPGFCVAILVVLVFSVRLGWLPSDGAASIDSSLTGFDWLADRAAHLVLPTLALSTHSIAIYARLTRTSMIEVSQLDFVRTARAKGVTTLALALRHVLRNALIPVSTVAGLQLGSILGGAATVEMVFSWPGIGRLALDMLDARDYNTLLGILLLSSLVIVLANLLVDLLQYRIDPRTRRGTATAGQAGPA
jgi:peptide/nickel transport system permease protein